MRFTSPSGLDERYRALVADDALRDELVGGAKMFCHQHSWIETAQKHRELWKELVT